ncbi:MAG: hypothetical protein ACI90V_008520 [Bacillariaceae sp.]
MQPYVMTDGSFVERKKTSSSWDQHTLWWSDRGNEACVEFVVHY